MSKELPYFRFTVQEWQNGGISTLNDSLKGIFIDVCAYYWAQNCNVTMEMLLNKFKTKIKSIQKLIDSQTFYNQNGIVSISFLDQQLSELKQNKTFFSEMGKLGQIVKKSKAPLKTDLSYKDKDNNKDFPPDSAPYILSDFMLKRILEINPNHKKPNLQSWSSEFDKLIRIDKRDPEHIKKLITAVFNDSFWRVNILSPSKLRKQYDQVTIKLLNVNKPEKPLGVIY